MTFKQRANPDFATLLGALVAVTSVVGGLILEGGSVRDIVQSSAALIVVGGTIGAVLISTPFRTLMGALRSVRSLFFDRALPLGETLEQVLMLSVKARKLGLTSLEIDARATRDPYLQKALHLIADNTPLEEMQSMMELELDLEETRLDSEAKVFETAGGYAPTIGIIGAVLGLIQVMKHLESIDDVGRGIAVSFVATVYGVALANLLLLPAAAKLRARAAGVVRSRELALEGVSGIVSGINPTLLRIKLQPFLSNDKPVRPVKLPNQLRPEARPEVSAA